MKRFSLLFTLAIMAVLVFAQSASAGNWPWEGPTEYNYDSLGLFVTRDNSGGDSTLCDTLTAWLANKNAHAAAGDLKCTYFEHGGGIYSKLCLQAERTNTFFLDADSVYAYVTVEQSMDKTLWFDVDSLAFTTADTLAGAYKEVALLAMPYFRLRSQGHAKLSDHVACSLMVKGFLER